MVPALLCSRAAAADPFSVLPELSPADGGKSVLSLSFTVPAGHHLYADPLTVEAEGAEIAEKDIPAPEDFDDPITDTRRAVYGRDFVRQYWVKWGSADLVSVAVSYQGCSESLCFQPQTKRFVIRKDGTIAASAETSQPPAPAPPAASTDWRVQVKRFWVADVRVGYVPARDFLDFLQGAESRKEGSAAKPQSRLVGRGFLATVFLILLGGLALNLTPCVLPMIPINIAIIGAGARAGSRARGFVVGVSYGSGIAAAYGALGLAALLGGSKFGALNSSPWFNVGVAVLFTALALAMLDVFLIDLSRFQGGRTAGTGGLIGAFVMGALSAFLAGACVAPIVLSVLVLAADLCGRGNLLGLFLPFLLGIGMGSIWPFVGAGLSLLPRPGAWMEWVKRVFAALVLLAALYYGYTAFDLFRTRMSASRAKVEAAMKPSVEGGWLVSLQEALAQAEKDRRPVFIDIWASWCKNCLAMEATTFKAPEVQARLRAFVKVKYRAEEPGRSPAKELLDYFGAPGLPAYAILVPRDGQAPAAAGAEAPGETAGDPR